MSTPCTTKIGAAAIRCLIRFTHYDVRVEWRHDSVVRGRAEEPR